MNTSACIVLALVCICLQRTEFVAGAAEASKVPKIVDQVERINHPEGTNATFTCTIGSGELNGLRFEWLKDDRRVVAASSRYRISVAPENFNSILRVIDLKPDDSGVYSCLARNAFGEDKISIRLVVKVELKWVEKPEDEIQAPIGKPLHVPCNASGQPAPQIEWIRLDGSEQGTRQSLGPELRFGAVSQQDSGFFECRASNGMDKDLVTRFKLSVMGKNFLDSKPITSGTMQVDESLVAYIATTYYNILPVLGSIKQLPGYDDKNFLLTDSTENKTYVLKIVNREDSIKELTDIIDEVLDNAYKYCETKRTVSRAHFLVPKLVETTGTKLSTLTTVKYRREERQPTTGGLENEEEDFVEVKCNIKLSEFFDGLTMFDYINGRGAVTLNNGEQNARLYLRLGRVCNQLYVFLRTQHHLLADLEQIRASLSNPWHLKRAEKFIMQHLDELYPETTDNSNQNTRRKLVLRVLEEYATTTKLELSKLAQFVVHSDLSTKNMLINAHSHNDDELKICLIDFQDLQTGPQVMDLAILMLYCIIEQELMPFDRALTLLPRWVYSGYQSGTAWPLNDAELKLAPSLMKLRLCQSLLNGQMAHKREPKNSYVLHTNQRGWPLLELMCDAKSTFGRPDDLVALWLTEKATAAERKSFK